MKLTKKLRDLLNENEKGLEGGITSRKVGKMTVFTFHNKNGDDVGMVRGFELQNKKVLLLDQVSKGSDFDSGPEHFMTKAYRMLLKEYPIIISDKVQTPKAAKIWDTLMKGEMSNKIIKTVDMNKKARYVIMKTLDNSYKIDFDLP